MALTSSVSVIDGVEFKNCQGPRGGAISYVGNDNNNLNIKGSTSFTSCSSLSNPGGAIHSILNNGGSTLIDNTQFESCNGANSDGGSIFAQINNGSLSINKVTFIGSSCSQPGSGGAIAIVQQNSYSHISITESSFTNCKTLPGSSSQYGWGGAIDIEIGFEAYFLTLENFQLKDLKFANCKASGAGNNLHILSDDTTAVGNQIITGSLVTVKDTSNLPNIISDLYSNEQYCFDYMGINISKADSGNAPFTDHEPLFVSPSLTPKFNDPYVVDAEYGKDEPICGNSRLKCQTIKYILNIDQMSIDDYPSNPATINIELQTNTQLENGIMINSNTPIGNDFQIQSSEYTSLGTDYIKRQIQTTSETQSLFIISNTGRLKLLGLHFDNLNPTSNNPLISISTDSDDTPQLQIEDCEFKQNPDSYSTFSLSHSIISINGGIMKIEKAMIESYKLMNEKSIILIQSDQTSTVTISGTSFISIAQQGTGNGAAINSQLNGESKLTIKDGSLFTECQSIGSGGAIYAIMNIGTSGGIFIEGTTLTTFSQCSASQLGGAIYLDISRGAEEKFDLAGASYLTNNYAQYGKSLFIDAYDLTQVVSQGSQDKLGTLSDSTEILQPEQIMGYDGIDKSLAIPLYYVYSSIAQDVYHVSNSDSNPNGNDNRFCGHFNWPCLTIGYGITQSEAASAPYQIGIKSGYKLNELITIDQDKKIIQIKNSLSSIGETTQTQSIMNIQGAGKFSITSGTIQLDKITFSINENATAGYMIEGITESAIININDCQMKMTVDSEGYSISYGLIELSSGNLIVNNLEVKDIIISDRSVIKVNEGVAQVSVMNCSLKNISKIGENNGGIIELSKNIGTSNEEQKMNVRIETSSFIQPISTSSSNIATSSPFIHVSIGQLEINSCSFGSDDESSDLGAHAISIEAECSKLIISKTNFTKLLSGGIQLEAGQGSQASIESCQFTNCGDGSQIAGVVYAVGLPGDNIGEVSITDSQFISCQGQQAGGIIFGDNVIPSSVKNNYFSWNSITDEKGAKDIYFLSKEMLDKAGGIEVIAEKYKYDKTDGYVGEVKISGFDTNFAQYLDCKTEGNEDCGVIPCGGTKEQTSESCKETIKEEEEIKGTKSKLSGGAIAGIIIGAVVVIVAIVVVIIVIVIYKKV
ncbi:MAG: hypothetical protein EZS28_029515 [Streblomastix strix]|uniref:Right handed beta helix domain-containing protein n=1 Tax=Streblomastix strix TaxID=222440 RepID=A0A5J4UWY0_9EUKA|nr:MAG: hypothetical protein EZS28_029515 [Streblomastix strix]